MILGIFIINNYSFLCIHQTGTAAVFNIILPTCCACDVIDDVEWPVKSICTFHCQVDFELQNRLSASEACHCKII